VNNSGRKYFVASNSRISFVLINNNQNVESAPLDWICAINSDCSVASVCFIELPTKNSFAEFY